MVLILYTTISKYRQEYTTFEELLKILPYSMQTKVLKQQTYNGRVASLLGKILLQTGLEHLGMNNIYSLQDIQYTKYLRPFFPDSNLDFNLSHSEDYVICSISIGYQTGIDIEHIKPISIHDFFDHMNMEERIKITTSEDPLISFYKYWTQKESVLKANGKGLGIALNEFIINNNETILEDKRWFIQEIAINDNYVCNLSTNCKTPQLKILPELQIGAHESR